MADEQSPLAAGFAPILNPLQLGFTEPFEVIPNHFIQRATRAQIGKIQELVTRLAPHGGHMALPLYQCELIEEPTPTGGVSGRWEPIAEEEWRYNVVSYIGPRGQSHKLADLEMVSNVSEVPLELPISYFSMGHGGYAHKASHYLSQAPNIRSRQVAAEMLRDVSAAYSEFLAVREDYPEIARALRLLDALKSLPHNSEFEVLGLFAIVEMLITHNPKLEDVGDSLTHQMRGKLPLLSRRFRRPLEYSRFGDVVPRDKVWARLYGFRSIVAHGGEPDFTQGDMALLKSKDDALTFLRGAVRALVRHCFKEPQLYRDLKEC